MWVLTACDAGGCRARKSRGENYKYRFEKELRILLCRYCATGRDKIGGSAGRDKQTRGHGERRTW